MDKHILKTQVSRRGALALMTMGAVTLASKLSSCVQVGGSGRIEVAKDLLREKYNREFEIFDTFYGWASSSKPKAFCREVGYNDMAFSLEFDFRERKILHDNYVGRRLGIQLEDVITGFATDVYVIKDDDIPLCREFLCRTDYQISEAPDDCDVLDSFMTSIRDGEYSVTNTDDWKRH